ncbi:sulfurtransferase [Permianibacter sp. IMCC34836]|uniref:sulfurtransferase n=1 Tax=Permianibacter fluminis TaxID=2738515 RepID=UPI0015560BE4|nr:sulfurtransferase [Permianibacter fluminis]NQD37677.1 sulfurtransferase [Permianibacter fluminis]
MSPLLITVTELANQIKHQPDTLCLVDCRAKLQFPDWGREQYLHGHIPGAQFADLERDLSGPIIAGKTGRHPLPTPAALASFFADIGISPTTQVVAYDDAGGAYACHLWWQLRWLGHDQCRILDGGLPAWVAAGQPLESGPVARQRAPFIGALRAGLTVTADELLQVDGLLQTETKRIVIDARGPARYAGKEEPIDPVAGHIPGALNLPFSGNLTADGHFLPATALRQRFADAGVTGTGSSATGSSENVVAYCGSGVTACHNIFAMALAGLPPAKLYPGSWSEWITDPSRPIARTN